MVFLLFLFCCCSCSDFFKNDYKDNSPTTGKLKVYYDEGLRLHVRNQSATFESQYKNAKVQLHEVSESEAVQALYNDSCETIVISRNLTDKETQAFASKQFVPRYSAVAKTAVAVIANAGSAFKIISLEDIKSLLSDGVPIRDTLGNLQKVTVLFDKNNSGVLHYMLDSVLKKKALAPNCNILNGTLESLNYVATHTNAIAFIDFAWLSDTDDPLYKENVAKIKFIAVSKSETSNYEYPNQSTFKLNSYPFIRTVYVIRKTGEFTLAKGFESFVAGPKGQLTFLKQGLLPTRQAERKIEVNMGQSAQ